MNKYVYSVVIQVLYMVILCPQVATRVTTDVRSFRSCVDVCTNNRRMDPPLIRGEEWKAAACVRRVVDAPVDDVPMKGRGSVGGPTWKVVLCLCIGRWVSFFRCVR